MKVIESDEREAVAQSYVDEALAELSEALNGEMSCSDWYDPWGTAISWAFALNDFAHALHLSTDGTYSPGLSYSTGVARWTDQANEPSDEPYENCRLGDLYMEDLLPPDELEAAVKIMSELLDQLRELGCNY